MNRRILPTPHQDPWVDLLRDYVTQAVTELARGGVHIERSWLDPSDPRDATIVYSAPAELRAVVWDEETGWRTGRFESGRQGHRTGLSDVSYLGGGVLPDARELTSRLLTGVSLSRGAFRTYHDRRDGLDDTLRAR